MQRVHFAYVITILPKCIRSHFNSSVVGCFRKFGVVGCVPYGMQGFLSSLVGSSGLFSNKMDSVPSDISLDTKMQVRYVQY